MNTDGGNYQRERIEGDGNPPIIRGSNQRTKTR